jgi:mono/diheme cytochrome c family protein
MQEITRLTPRGKLFAGVLLLIGSGIAAMAVSSSPRSVNRRHAPKHAAKSAVFDAKPTPARLARGRYLVETVGGCFDCHTIHEYVNGQWVPKKGMKGAGQAFPAGFLPLPPGADVVAPNITPDRQTGIGSWTDAEIERAIRHGVAKGGRPLFDLMPYWQFRVLTNEDVKSIIVYLRSLRPVHNALPVTKMPFPVRVNMNDPLVPPLAKNASPLVRRGWYLVRVAGCADCHTPIVKNGSRPPSLLFAGGMRFHGPFGTVFSTNITFDSSGIAFMNEPMFSRTIRTGRVNATGQQLKPPMPFRDFHNLKPADIRAIYAYLRTVPHVRHNIDNTDPPTYCKIDGEMHGLGDRN